ncbi:MAG: YceI family protein [Candidatus Acidiferrales bacterium]
MIQRTLDPRLAFSAVRSRCFRAFAVAASLFVLASTLNAQDVVVNFDAATTQVEFTLGATLHTVHGVFKLKSGQIHFDRATGKAGGVVILDATSGNTGNSSRDKKMHAEILESAKFPEIAFSPTQVTGPVVEMLAGKPVQLRVAGVFRLHGQDHAMTIPVTVAPASGSGRSGLLEASTTFDVPYVKWGLKNPSTFVLHVSDTVNLAIHSAAQIARPGASR